MTKQHYSGDCGAIRCITENWVRNSGCFVLIDDNSHNTDGTTRKFFTRVFALKLGGTVTTYRVKFIYDYRTKIATVDFDNIALQALSVESRKEVVDESKLIESIERTKIKVD